MPYGFRDILPTLAQHFIPVTLPHCKPKRTVRRDMLAQHTLNMSPEHLLGQRVQMAGMGPRHLQKACTS